LLFSNVLRDRSAQLLWGNRKHLYARLRFQLDGEFVFTRVAANRMKNYSLISHAKLKKVKRCVLLWQWCQN